MEQLMDPVDTYNLSSSINLCTNYECGICGANHITADCSLVHISCQLQELGLSLTFVILTTSLNSLEQNSVFCLILDRLYRTLLKRQIRKVQVPDKYIPSKARLSLPDLFDVKALVDESFNVYATEFISKGTQFGPFQAKLLLNMKPTIRFPLKVFTNDAEDFPEYYLDTSDENECSWLYFISPAVSIDEQNVICYQDKNEIYYGTIKDINAGDPLKVWYSPHYATKMNKQILESTETIEEDIKSADVNEIVKKQQKIMERDIWNCKFCGKLEKDITIFANHLLEHYRLQSKKTCELCKSSFSTVLLLKKHLKIVHPSQYVNTSNKESSIRVNSKKNNENKDVPLGGPLLNDIMMDSMDNSNQMLQPTDLHQFDLSNIHNHNILLESENFNVDNLLTENVKDLDHFNFELKDAEEDIICDICLKSFTKLRSLIQHLEQHTGNFWCKQCNRVFCRKENWKAHLCNGIYKFGCPECKKIFVQKKYLSQHMRVVHTKKFSCDICSQFFLSKEGLKIHSCKTVKKQKLYCNQCPKFFHNEVYLKNHLKRHSVNDSPKQLFICEICSKVLKSKTNLTLHLKIHGEPELSCEICSKKFHRMDVLKNHQLSHVKVTSEQHKCKNCEKTFKSKKLLWFHKKNHEEALYKCSDCPAVFKQNGNLAKHRTSKHSSLNKSRPDLSEFYECPLCNKTMKLKSSLSRHLKRKHSKFNDDLYMLNITPKKNNKQDKAKKVDTCIKQDQIETDMTYMDLKETIENMNFTTDISMEGNENNINMEFEDMLKCTTEDIDFLNESNDRLVENLLNIPIETENITAKGQQTDMPNLNGSDEVELGNDAFILKNTAIVNPHNGNEEVVLYILGENLQV